MNFINEDNNISKGYSNNDSKLCNSNTVLVTLSVSDEINELCGQFFGLVVDDVSRLPDLQGKIVYVCGDMTKAAAIDVNSAKQVYVIQQLSSDYCESILSNCPLIDIGQVPINVHDVGVYYRRLFSTDADYFSSIQSEHAFQSLTESTKPATAHRTGIYLTPVEVDEQDSVHFRLLRCSSNLSGPTANFGCSDRTIVESLNHEAESIFENNAPLNHVLAQIYHNTPSSGKGTKAIKAKIKDHSDKTKDMPENGLMAFVTFYDKLDIDELQTLDKYSFDFGVGGKSALTQLKFRLKACVLERDPNSQLRRHFEVTLFPNSVFFMPLSTNRLYTHEIRPSQLDVRSIPTRMGYVVRCSNAEAVHKQGQTFLKGTNDNELVPLQPPTDEGMTNLRHFYALENRTDDVLDYGDVLFSMNKGDYVRPISYGLKDDFNLRVLYPSLQGSLFADLKSSINFENVGKGRLGTALVKPDASRGVPIVRTTSRYSLPATAFGEIHEKLANDIKELYSLPCEFNNALVECYTNEYATMGYHSDQALDLEEGTSIALFSCYKYPEKRGKTSRKLVVQSKEFDECTFEVPLLHNSVVVFSVDNNKRFKHKIVLDQNSRPDEDQEWFGVTLRTSKTFVKFNDNDCLFENGVPLTEASAEQRQEFFKLRRCENEQLDFVYPFLTYTISESDLMPPTTKSSQCKSEKE